MSIHNQQLNAKIEHKRSFIEKTILKILQALPLGTLHVYLPWGEHLHIGHSSYPVEAHLYIKNRDFFLKVFLYGDIGFAEAYMDGDWDSPNITDLVAYFIANAEHAPFMEESLAKKSIINAFKWVNKIYHNGRANTLFGAKKNIAAHYDIGNDFYKLWLDESMTYSSALYTHAEMALHEAQYNKYKRLAHILQLQPHDHVLEIGCGWGANAIYMAEKFGCLVTAVTLSEKQHAYASEKIKERGLEKQVKVQLADYRSLSGSFDKIVSIEMVEAVGERFLPVYFKKCHELLKKDGILALQAITIPDCNYAQLKKGVDFIQKHIFPGSLLTSVAAINQAINQTGDLTLVDVHEMGLHYARTLQTWDKNFTHKVENVRKLGYTEPFIRKWHYYLSYCEAAFSMRHINVMQMAYVRPHNLKWKRGQS